MKNKKCPYCGRRIRYVAVFRARKHGSYACERCKKESKVKIDNRMLIVFAALVLLMVLFMIVWTNAWLSNNLFGLFVVAASMIGFNYATPLFVNFVPIKKYKDDIDNTKSYEEKIDIDTIGDSDFVFNREAFEKIKRQKEAGITKNFDIEDNLSVDKKETMVPVIEDVKEGHVSSSDGPLQKINRQPKPYIPEYESFDEEIEQVDDVKQYVPKRDKRPDGTKYTANRRF